MRASPLLRNVNFSPLSVQVLGRTVSSNFKSMHIVCGIPGTSGFLCLPCPPGMQFGWLLCAQSKSSLRHGGRVTVIVIRRSLEAEPGTHCGNGLCSGIQQVQQKGQFPFNLHW